MLLGQATTPGPWPNKLTWQEYVEIEDRLLPNTHDERCGPGEWRPYWVTLADIAESAKVSPATVARWARHPTFPIEPDGTVNPWLAGLWKSRMDCDARNASACPHCSK